MDDHSDPTGLLVRGEYDRVDIHRRMVGDRPRTSAFRDSIAATVAPGDVVLDVGTGSGILALLAAQAGAARVYAVEREPGAVALARRLVADNGFGDRVEVIASDIGDVELTEEVDVIVSEWLGVFGVDENLLAPTLHARDRFLRESGVMIPSVVTAWMAPVCHPVAGEALQFRTGEYGLDLSALAPYDPNLAVWLPSGVTPDQLCAEPAALWRHDLATMPVEQATQPFAANCGFTLTAGGVNGLAAWFGAEMPGAALLTNAPGAPLTHWGHFLFPIATAAGHDVGDRLDIGFHNVPARSGESNHLWSLHDGARLIESHDTRRARRNHGDPPWYVANDH